MQCLLIGDSAVGKSSIVERYTEGDFKSNFISTIGVDFKIRSFVWNSKIVKLQIWYEINHAIEVESDLIFSSLQGHSRSREISIHRA